MSILKIYKYGEPILKKKCLPVKEITPEIKKLAGDMLETMYINNGVGLAASQVGVPDRICVIDVRPEGKRKPLVLINPKITDKSGKMLEEEGCLSFPGIAASIKRHKNVKVSAINENGMPVIVEGAGLLSKALQHELDHLDGKVFISRLPIYKKLHVQYLIRKRKKLGEW
ncbi:MAG: peptide deformylase [Elusimicrobia bacterium]|nr:peptide deformylase [Candidatus Liberimonas magnetica]